jgi:hypothetical protein
MYELAFHGCVTEYLTQLQACSLGFERESPSASLPIESLNTCAEEDPLLGSATADRIQKNHSSVKESLKVDENDDPVPTSLLYLGVKEFEASRAELAQKVKCLKRGIPVIDIELIPA